MRATTNDLTVFVQARLGSSRFPRKILAQLAGRPVLEWVLRALERTPAAVKLVLTDAETAPEIRLLAARAGFGVFVGSPDDVLSRFADAVRSFTPRPRWIVRACGDSPLIRADLVPEVLEVTQDAGLDLAAPVDIPPGMGFEIIRTRSLLAAEKACHDPASREHVTAGMWRGAWKTARVGLGLGGADLPSVSIETATDIPRVARLLREAKSSGRTPLEILQAEAARDRDLVEMRMGE